MDTLFFVARHLCKVRSGLLCIYFQIMHLCPLDYLSLRMEFSSNTYMVFVSQYVLLCSLFKILLNDAYFSHAYLF